MGSLNVPGGPLDVPLRSSDLLWPYREVLKTLIIRRWFRSLGILWVLGECSKVLGEAPWGVTSKKVRGIRANYTVAEGNNKDLVQGLQSGGLQSGGGQWSGH